jgi:anti-sigma regulatory factor (Ser/Thr protein kinase)
LTDHASPSLTDHAVVQVKLVIPCLAEYVGVARLAVLGVANRLAVGEACTHAIERHTAYYSSKSDVSDSSDACTIKIVSTIDKSTLTIEVTDTIPVISGHAVASSGDDDLDYQKLGTVLMEILVDEVTFNESQHGTTVKLVKSAGQVS